MRCRFQRLPVPGVLTVGFDPAGRIGSMTIRPDAADPKEYPSPYLDYLPKTRFELPFNGEWLVFWGGRTLGENYHAASRAQRFAHDLVMVRDGARTPIRARRSRATTAGQLIPRWCRRRCWRDTARPAHRLRDAAHPGGNRRHRPRQLRVRRSRTCSRTRCEGGTRVKRAR
jgi:hypothetical protein